MLRDLEAERIGGELDLVMSLKHLASVVENLSNIIITSLGLDPTTQSETS